LNDRAEDGVRPEDGVRVGEVRIDEVRDRVGDLLGVGDVLSM
jgi:hypothetical protein